MLKVDIRNSAVHLNKIVKWILSDWEFLSAVYDLFPHLRHKTQDTEQEYTCYHMKYVVGPFFFVQKKKGIRCDYNVLVKRRINEHA